MSQRDASSPVLSDVVERLPASNPVPPDVIGARLRLRADRVKTFQKVNSKLTHDEEHCFSAVREGVFEDECKRSSEVVQRPVAGFEFGVLSERDAIRGSVVRITTKTYVITTQNPTGRNGDVQVSHIPHPHGPLSQYLGPILRGTPCDTCGGIFGDDYSIAPNPRGIYPCPGHLGHIITPGAVFLAEFVNPLDRVPIRMLTCICWLCGEMPATKAKCARVIDMLLTCDKNGTPLNPEERLRLMYNEMKNEKKCHNCASKIRCVNCKNDKQCHECSRHIEYRPQIKLRSKVPDAESFRDFPYVVTWGIENMETDAEREKFAAFKARHERLNETMLTFNPERARKMWSVVSPSVALLLTATLPRGPYRTKGDVFTRVFGAQTVEKMAKLHSAALTTAEDVFTGSTTRALVVNSNLGRPTRVNGSLASIEVNEQTRHFHSILEQIDKINAMVQNVSGEDNRAIPPLAPPRSDTEAATNLGTSIDRKNENDLERDVPLRHTRQSFWYERTRADHSLIAPLYGTLQYLVILLHAPAQALKWHPTGSSASRPNSTQPGAEKTKDKANAIITRLKGKKSLPRENLTGKRVDFSSRTVITPDPSVDIDELVLPWKVAAHWTVPVTLNDFNYKTVLDAAERCRLTMQRINKECTDAGVNTIKELPNRVLYRLYLDDTLDKAVIEMGSVTLYLWNEQGTERFEYTQFSHPVWEHPVARRSGSRIERPLRDGDYVVFNRAPSLHVVSMMAHRVHMRRISSKSYNPVVCSPYNADFDGDEVRQCKCVLLC